MVEVQGIVFCLAQVDFLVHEYGLFIKFHIEEEKPYGLVRLFVGTHSGYRDIWIGEIVLGDYLDSIFVFFDL